MREVAADATVLIFLGSIQRLEWLRREYDQILVPPVVNEEVVDRGKAAGHPDAVRVETAIEEEWIAVETPASTATIDRYDLEAGETAVLSLALERDHDIVLADEEAVREVARFHDLEPRGTLSVLFDALAAGRCDFGEFVELLEALLEAGFYLDESLYLKAIREARELAD
jgi:predicted nucleic acid-binding protein